MLQLEKEFQNNYFSKLRIKACLGAGREIPNVREKHHSSGQKIIILREFLENNIPISHVAEKYNVHVNDIYKLEEETV